MVTQAPGRVVVVTPTYNEALNIARVGAGLRRSLPGAHWLIVDDASPDGTGRLADDIAAGDSLVHVLHRPGKAGLGSAYRAGFDWARRHDFEVVVEMDADLSHDPSDLRRLVDALDCGADLVIGSRYVSGGRVPDWPRRRRLLSWGANRYARLTLRIPVFDATAGFRAFRASLLAEPSVQGITSQGYAFQIETTLAACRVGARVIELPITFTDRRAGRSKMDRAIVWEAVRVVAREAAHGGISRRPGREHRRADLPVVPRPKISSAAR